MSVGCVHAPMLICSYMKKMKKRSCFHGENKNGLIIPMLFQIAAFICEPIMTAAGIVVYPENYLQYTLSLIHI